MSTVVAVRGKGRVCIAGDTGAWRNNERGRLTSDHSKVWIPTLVTEDRWVIGLCGSGFMIQLIRDLYAPSSPTGSAVDAWSWLVAETILKRYKAVQQEGEKFNGYDLLVAHEERIWYVDIAGVTELADEVVAIGIGGPYARGAAVALQLYPELSATPEDVARTAIVVANSCCEGASMPLVCHSTRDP